jgi:hypothetical protein
MRAAISWLVISRQAVARLLAEPGPVEFQCQLAQLLAGQVARAGQHGHQRRDGIAVRADELA